MHLAWWITAINNEFTLAMYYVDADLNIVNKEYSYCLNIKILCTSKCIGICTDGAAAIMEVLKKPIYRQLKIITILIP